MVKKSTLSLLCITLATLCVNMYGTFYYLPFSLKGFVSLLVWFGVFLIPFQKNSDFSKPVNALYFLLLSYSLVLILRSVFYINEIYTVGNNWLTLFGNDVMAQSLLPPLFIYFSKNIFILKNIKIAIFFLIVMVLLTSLPQGLFLPVSMFFSIPFFYYRKTKIENIAILALVILGFFAGFALYRVGILTTIFGIGALYLPKLLPSKIFRILVFTIFLSPFFIFSWSLKNQISFFEVISTKIENEDLRVDTRTFLYLELYKDLGKNKAILFGKGALSGYQSDWFKTKKNTIGRTGSESYFLNLILKGGLAYLLLIQLIIFVAIYLALKKGTNQLSKSFAFSLAGFNLLSFIGNFSGANLLHISIWVMIGFCLSKFWTSRTDQQLIHLIYNKNLNLISYKKRKIND